MITVTKASKELTKREQFKLTKSQQPILIKDLEDGVEITPDYWAIYEDTDKDTEVLSIVDTEGQVLSTISETFKKNFLDIADIFQDEDYTIKKISGTTKAGRSFVNCDLVD